MRAFMTAVLVAGVSLTACAVADSNDNPTDDDAALESSQVLATCQPSAAHPRPVVLVHGTFANKNDNWLTLGPELRHAGYCVYALNYGGNTFTKLTLNTVFGLGPIESSAGQLATFVDKVLAATGASQVDVVGHSQGGMMPRYYLKFLGGAAKVHEMVGFGSSNHGTTLDGLTVLAKAFPGLADFAIGSWCQSCLEQVRGSDFLVKLNNGGDTVPGVHYTVISTTFDEVVTPFTSQFLSGTSVTNIHLQDRCPFDLSDHVALAFDPAVARDVLNALDPAHAVASCSL
jgi:triacylglycerol esterase/lipase EstA (alpha/beta hydrolase family)